MSLQDVFNDGIVDCFSIIESKIDDSFPDAQFAVEGYNLLRQDRTDSSGGLMTYVRSDLPHIRRADFEINNDCFQSLCIEISVNKEIWLVNTIYRPPSSSLEEYSLALHSSADKMLVRSGNLIIMGDTNINTLNPSKASFVNDFMNTFSFTQMVREPTCFKGNPTLIDHIYTSIPRRLSSTINFNCGLSDFHNFIAICTKISVPTKSAQFLFDRSYKHFSESEFLRDLETIPFHVADVFSDIDDYYWAFDCLLRDIIDTHAPVKKKKINPREAPFMNSALRKAMYAKRQAHNKARKNPTNQRLWEDFQKKRNSFVSLRRSSMRKYFKDRCSNASNSKSFWQTIRPFFTNKKALSDCPALQENDTVYTKPCDIAKIFSDYYSSITDDIGLNEDPSLNLNDIIAHYGNHPSVNKIRQINTGQSFHLKCVSTSDVVKILKSVNPSKATGHDRFPPKILKISAPVLTEHITQIANKIITFGLFPTSLKKAEITPVFKSKNRYDKCNYRPISILSCISIIIEKVINSQLVNFTNEILHHKISAYRKSHNTESVVVKAVEDWKKSLDAGNAAAGVSMDLSKAFDVLPHGLLLAKLDAYGFHSSTLRILHDYLSQRSQRVKIDNSMSAWTLIKKGVPQGSVLGPVLFNLFLNDIFHFVKYCSIYNYADDNVLSLSSNNIHDLKRKLEFDIDAILTWFRINGMKANPSKFQLISFGNSTLTDISVGNTVIQTSSCIKYLGVLVDNKLSFNDHVCHIKSKASKQVNALLRLSSNLDKDVKLILYRSFISAHFDYCPIVWSLCNKTTFNMLSSVQRRALRFVCGNYDASYSELLQECNAIDLSKQCIIKIAIAMYKIVNELSPSFVSSLFIKNNSRNLRNDKTFTLQYPRTTKYGKLSFAYIGAKLWNEIPAVIKDSSLHNFKKLIAQHTRDGVWSYVNEF